MKKCFAFYFFYSRVSPKSNSYKKNTFLVFFLFLFYMTLQCNMSKIVHFSMMLCIVIFVIWCLPFCTKITAIWLENKKHIEAFKYCCTSRDQKSRQATNWVVTSVTNVTFTTVLLVNILNGQFPKLFGFLFCYCFFINRLVIS